MKRFCDLKIQINSELHYKENKKSKIYIKYYKTSYH